MTNPIRVQRSRKHKQVSPNGLPIIYVGRPSEFGNPYPKSLWGVEKAISNYRDYIETCIKTGSIDIEKLKGKNLSCWCSLNTPCHADILLELANKTILTMQDPKCFSSEHILQVYEQLQNIDWSREEEREEQDENIPDENNED